VRRRSPLLAVGPELALLEEEGVVVAAVDDLPRAHHHAILPERKLRLEHFDQRFQLFASHDATSGAPARYIQPSGARWGHFSLAQPPYARSRAMMSARMATAHQFQLGVELASGKRSLALANPVMAASGTFSYGVEYAKVFDVQRLGAIVSKTTTLRPYAGSPAGRRIDETPAGMLNSIGLQNIGMDRLIRDMAPVWERWRVPVVVSILGATPDEYGACAARLEGVAGIAGLELNISSPNAQQGGMEFGQDARSAAAVTAAVVRASTLPVIVKLTPNVTDIAQIARACVDAGADALCVVNTLQAMAIDARTRSPRIARTFAGLSGPAMKPVALRMVWQVAAAVDVPVIGCGGISNGTDAVEFLLAGATAVQVGTATFRNPCAPLDVLEGIEAYLREHNIAGVRELIGAARR
jgi:dihydroorotate dehydrogenase (NAD+) catalytic subunit